MTSKFAAARERGGGRYREALTCRSGRASGASLPGYWQLIQRSGFTLAPLRDLT